MSTIARYWPSSLSDCVVNGSGGVSRIVTFLITMRSVSLPSPSTGASEMACTTSMPSLTVPNTVYCPSSAG